MQLKFQHYCSETKNSTLLQKLQALLIVHDQLSSSFTSLIFHIMAHACTSTGYELFKDEVLKDSRCTFYTF